MSVIKPGLAQVTTPGFFGDKVTRICRAPTSSKIADIVRDTQINTLRLLISKITSDEAN